MRRLLPFGMRLNSACKNAVLILFCFDRVCFCHSTSCCDLANLASTSEGSAFIGRGALGGRVSFL